LKGGKMGYPKIYLAIDNCFAYKRWTEPLEWGSLIRDMGLRFIEASSDTELDPLYMGREYLSWWQKEVKKAEEKLDIKIANVYSGHGSYTTLGLTHTNKPVRERMIEEWFKPLIDTAAALNAGMGFFAHGFSNRILQDPVDYYVFEDILIENLSRLNRYAQEAGCGDLALEQMYSPHQIPWRIPQASELLKDVTKLSGGNFYITQDAGHHSRKYIKPNKADIVHTLQNMKNGGYPEIWLGVDACYVLLEKAAALQGGDQKKYIQKITALMDERPDLFSEDCDGDFYAWLKKLGSYSPIIHLQQTDGQTSEHRPFTKEYNARGIVRPMEVLQAIRFCYEQPEETDMPKRADNIYLTLELFSPTASINYYTLRNIKESIDFWRQFIPEDGKPLDELTR
jgi:D-erythrulose 1-phosphate 3-epimerase